MKTIYRVEAINNGTGIFSYEVDNIASIKSIEHKNLSLTIELSIRFDEWIEKLDCVNESNLIDFDNEGLLLAKELTLFLEHDHIVEYKIDGTYKPIKYYKVMADYAWAYLWCDEGLTGFDEIDEELEKKYAPLFENWSAKLSLSDENKLDWNEFNKEGLDLLSKVEKESPKDIVYEYVEAFEQYTVSNMYYDGEKFDTSHIEKYMAECKANNQNIWFADNLEDFLPKLTEEQKREIMVMNVFDSHYPISDLTNKDCANRLSYGFKNDNLYPIYCLMHIDCVFYGKEKTIKGKRKIIDYFEMKLKEIRDGKIVSSDVLVLKNESYALIYDEKEEDHESYIFKVHNDKLIEISQIDF